MISVASTAPLDGSDRTWLDQLGQVNNWTHRVQLPGGDTSAKFNFTPPSSPFNDPALVPGRRVYAYAGASLRFSGKLDEVDRSTNPWQCTATGLAAEATVRISTTSTLDTAVDNAISNGLPWQRRNSLTSLYSPTFPAPAPLSDQLAVLLGGNVYWTLSAAGAVSTIAIPTAPTYRLAVHALPGRTLNNYYDVEVVQWGSSTTTVLGSTSELALRARVERLISSNATTLADAKAAGQQQLITDQQRAWSGTFTAQPGTLFTMTGVPVWDLSSVRPAVVRLDALIPDDQGTQTVDLLMGQTDYDDTGGTQVAFTPMAVSSNNLTTVIANGLGGAA